MAANQTEFYKCELRSVRKLMLADKCKQCENYRRMCYVFGEACFSQNIFKKELYLGLQLQVWVKKKTVWGEETCWLSIKKKVPGAAVNKKVMQTVF